MKTVRCNDNWIQFDSHKNQSFEDEVEALSFCDLPTNEHPIKINSNKEDNEPVDFEFASGQGGAACRSPEKMCTADEVFFHGQILPLINRSEFMSVVSNRSKENDTIKIRSNGYGYRYKPKIRNQFHEHPSPSPQIRTHNFRTFSQSKPKSSSLWSVFQVGLVKPQEIGLSDLKKRSKRFGSHNSSSSNSSLNDSNDQNKKQNKMNHRKSVKKKQRFFFGGCSCGANSIDCTVKETVPKKMMNKEENMLNEICWCRKKEK